MINFSDIKEDFLLKYPKGTHKDLQEYMNKLVMHVMERYYVEQKQHNIEYTDNDLCYIGKIIETFEYVDATAIFKDKIDIYLIKDYEYTKQRIKEIIPDYFSISYKLKKRITDCRHCNYNDEHGCQINCECLDDNYKYIEIK